MAEVLGLVSSFITIGQVLTAVPKIISSLRSLGDMKAEVSALIHELECLRSSHDYINDTLKAVDVQDGPGLISTSKPEFCRNVEAQLEDVMNQLPKLISDCHRGFDKQCRPRPSRVKWLWKKGSVKKLHADARQARLDLHLIISGHIAYVQRTQGRSVDSKLLDISNQLYQLVAPDSSPASPSTNIDIIESNNDILEVDPPTMPRSGCESNDSAPDPHMSCAYRQHKHTTDTEKTHTVLDDKTVLDPIPIAPFPGSECLNSTNYVPSGNIFATSFIFLRYRRQPRQVKFKLNRGLLFGRDLYIELRSSAIGGSSLRLRTPRSLSSDDEIWDSVRDGDISKIGIALCKKRCDPDSADENGHTLLYTALLSRQFRMAQYLRTTGAPIDFRTTRLAQEIISSIYDMSKRPALEIELLRDLARDFEDIGISKYTGIHTAAKGLYDIKQQLEGDTESLDQPDENGNSALHWACHGGNVPVLRLLLDAGANVNAQNKSKQTPLMKAAHRGNVACVRALLEIPSCDPNKVDLQGRSALHHAAASPYAGGSEVMGLLLSHAANPFLRNNGGETVVHELASSYTSKLPAEELHSRLEALVGAGSKLDSVDGWNYTPALQAVAEDNSAALEALLHLGALVGGADCDKQNVFHLSALYGSLKTFQQLRDAHIRGIDIAGLNYQQDTPFELFEWRYGLQEGSLGIETSRKSTTREYETFRALLWESRNRNLETDIESCHRILKALQREDVVSAMQDLDELVDRYAAWVKEDEFEMYRNIRLEIEDGSFGLVARSLTEAIKFSTEAMDDCPIGDFRHDCSDVSSDD